MSQVFADAAKDIATLDKVCMDILLAQSLFMMFMIISLVRTKYMQADREEYNRSHQLSL